MSRELKGIGRPVRLPFKVAVQVAWTSIRVRMVRSLVTVSSVVLAVAFLLNVLGEAEATRAVWTSYEAATRPARQTATIREILERPRDPRTAIALAARDPQALASWLASVQSAPATMPDADTAALALRLCTWVDDLRASQIYLLVRQRGTTGWVVRLDEPEAITRAIEIMAGFKGVRQPTDKAGLERLAAAGETLRGLLDAFQSAERARLAQVRAAGGADAVITALAGAATDEALIRSGLPLAQIVPNLSSADRSALVAQARRDRLRSVAAAALSASAQEDPSLLRADDVSDWPALHKALTTAAAAEGKSPAKRLKSQSARLAAAIDAPPDATKLREALNSMLGSTAIWDAETFKGLPLGDEAMGLAKQNLGRLGERRIARFNRLLIEAALPGLIRNRALPPQLDLPRLADGSLQANPAAADALASLATALGAAGAGTDGIAELKADLAGRDHAAGLQATFAGMSYDPDSGGERTFWLVVLSLLVCVVGIVNTMTMAVTERFREIATMKCLGALDSFILKAFLIESAAMGLVGAMVGAVLGLILVLLQSWVTFGSAFWAAFPVGGLAQAAALAIGCGLGLAIIGALIPAFQASRMAPIEAMRVDL